MSDGVDLHLVDPETGDAPPATDRAAWIAAGRALAAGRSETSWAFADWLVEGHRAFGKEAMQEAAETAGASLGKIRNYLSVATNYPLIRRRITLGFSHHLEVARLPEADADRLLDQAEADGWSVVTLREVVREARESTLDRLRAENARLRTENAALKRGVDDRNWAMIEAQRLREDLKADCKAFVVASRRIAELLEAAANSPALAALHGNARLALVKWIRETLEAVGAQAAADAKERSLPAVARLAGEGQNQTSGRAP